MPKRSALNSVLACFSIHTQLARSGERHVSLQLAAHAVALSPSTATSAANARDVDGFALLAFIADVRAPDLQVGYTYVNFCSSAVACNLVGKSNKRNSVLPSYG